MIRPRVMDDRDAFIDSAGPGERPMRSEQAKPIRVLFVEDLDVDMERELYQLQRDGLQCTWQRVETEQSLRAALGEFEPTIVLSDFSLPQFDGMSALRVVRELRPEVPFVFVSGTIGEERAITALRAGAVDYVLKRSEERRVGKECRSRW